MKALEHGFNFAHASIGPIKLQLEVLLAKVDAIERVRFRDLANVVVRRE